MHIINGIAYAGEPTPAVKVVGVRPMSGHKLWVRFNTGEARMVDFVPFLAESAFAPLRDEDTFRDVYLDYGVTVWMDGAIDIAPELLYAKGVATELGA